MNIGFKPMHKPPFGQKCLRNKHHFGPCAAVPAWWNIPGRIKLALQERRR